MDLKAHNTRHMPLHFKEVELLIGLTAAHISGIQVLLDFIYIGAKLHGDAIITFVDILVDVLECSNRGYGLNVDVAAVLSYEILGVAHDSTIVNLLSSNYMGLASVRASSAGIGVL